MSPMSFAGKDLAQLFDSASIAMLKARANSFCGVPVRIFFAKTVVLLVKA